MSSSVPVEKLALPILVALLSLSSFAFAADDISPPIIVHEPVTAGTEGQRILVRAVIMDDIGITGATLYYRRTGDSGFSAVPMVLCDECVDVYEAAIPASAITTAGVEYYISATDGTNVTTHPTSNPESSPHVVGMIEAAQSEFPWIWLAAAVLLIAGISVVGILFRKRTRKTSGTGTD
ncbi:MAG: hypothetical protein JSW53_06105 [Candidatus Bathyarchaeota archaeon]|nr:MAG: hypothetical protein JSW53_06105 [Candidatus Bathyarchaeota archaeon]